MTAVLKGAQYGGELGAVLGPEGEVVGAGIGGLAGLAATLGQFARGEHKDPEREPLIHHAAPPNVFQTGIRQRRPPPPVAGRAVPPPVVTPPLTPQERIDNRGLPKRIAGGLAGAAAVLGTGAVATAVRNPSQTLPDVPDSDPGGQSSPSNESGTHGADPVITPPTPAPSVSVNPAPTPQQAQSSGSTDSSRYVGNYRTPLVPGRQFNYVTATRYAEGDTLASMY